jgi:PhzF family phenazine biosynthesis protein
LPIAHAKNHAKQEMDMAQRITQVDAFTARRFSGDPAAVCVLHERRESEWMQDVAAEMNLSETAFALRLDGPGRFNLRWFTPNSEVDLCGHATLATAHVLWEEGHIQSDQGPHFETRSGVLTARRGPRGIELDFPREAVESEVTSPAELALLEAAIPARILFAGRNRFDLLVELEDEATLTSLRPDIRKLEALPCRGVIVTSGSADPEFDFASRFFAPRVGVDEDPVCGSAHCCLGPYWGEKLGKSELTGHPRSRRGGVVGVRVEGPRVVLIGQAVTVLRGELV